jgi:hypothetical protein
MEIGCGLAKLKANEKNATNDHNTKRVEKHERIHHAFSGQKNGRNDDVSSEPATPVIVCALPNTIAGVDKPYRSDIVHVQCC